MQASLPYFTTVFFANAPTPEPRQIVCVLAKRTYELDASGRLRRAKEQAPLALDGEYTEVTADQPCSVPLAEPDLWPSKAATDVVVLGKVHAPGARPARALTAGLSIGAHRLAIKVSGDRRVSRGPGGGLVFAAPEPFTAMELTWARAYGGIDGSVPMPEIGDLVDLLDAMDTERHPGAYPRNPAGRGYTIAGSALDELLLPNFEDPEDLLTPNRLLVGSPANWWRMPLPAGLGWFHPSWYPRCMFAGILPRTPPLDDDALPEVRMGIVPPGQYRRVEALDIAERMDWRLTSGAAPRLCLPYLQGDEAVQLHNLDPGGELRLRLPGERPRIDVSFERKALAVKTYLHTVLIEPEERRVSLVWGTRGFTPRLLPEEQPDQDNPRVDPLKGFDILVDGAIYPHQEEDYLAP